MTTELSPETDAIRHTIIRLVDYNESEACVVTDTAWMRHTRSDFDGGIPQNLYLNVGSIESKRRHTAVQTDIVEKFGLMESDIERLEDYDDDGSVKVPEWVIFSFLDSKLLFEDEHGKVINNVYTSGSGLVLDDSLVWNLSRDESGIGWWIRPTEIDGHKFRAMYAGYLAGVLQSQQLTE